MTLATQRDMIGRALRVTGVKVFSASKARERVALGDEITRWLRARPQCEILDVKVTQSSDAEFHCLTITLFYGDRHE